MVLYMIFFTSLLNTFHTEETVVFMEWIMGEEVCERLQTKLFVASTSGRSLLASASGLDSGWPSSRPSDTRGHFTSAEPRSTSKNSRNVT